MYRFLDASAKVAGFVTMAVVLSIPSRASALATEEVGNKPIAIGFGFSAELLAAVNVPERVYWYEVNGNPHFYFRGTSRDVNEAIRKFAAIPAEKREIVLLPGRAETKTLSGEQRIEFNWCLHVPMGLKFDGDPEIGDNRATLTIHIAEPNPAPLADRAQFRHWINDLDSNDFKIRDKAARALEDLGRDAAPALREVLASKISAEVENRIERLLARLETIDLALLRFPKGVPVIGMEALLERSRKALKSKEPNVRGYALTSLAHHCAGAGEVLPDLLKALEVEKHEYPLRCAASALARLGDAARPAIPAMREQLKSDDKNVKHSFEQAIGIIEKAKNSGDSDAEAMKRASIRRDISGFLKTRGTNKSQ
jgi:hypothetical protein